MRDVKKKFSDERHLKYRLCWLNDVFTVWNVAYEYLVFLAYEEENLQNGSVFFYPA